MSKLLPCPFCGGEAIIERIGDRRQSTLYACNWCSCSLETGEEWDHGKEWNTRQNADEVIEAKDARIKELEANNKRLRDALESIANKCAAFEHINLIGKNSTKAKRGGTLRNVMMIARAALGEVKP